MSAYGDFYENNVTGERAVILDTGDGTGTAIVHLTVQPGGAVVGEHIHPSIAETFTVVSGTLGVTLGGAKSTLTAGEAATAAAGVAHDWWNAGDDEASVIIALTPFEPRFETMIATLFGLANAGKTNAKGLPSPPQLGLIGKEFSDVIRFTKPPAAIQSVAFAILGQIGRWRGLSATYPEYLEPHGHTEPDPAALAAAGITPPTPTAS